MLFLYLNNILMFLMHKLIDFRKFLKAALYTKSIKIHLREDCEK